MWKSAGLLSLALAFLLVAQAQDVRGRGIMNGVHLVVALPNFSIDPWTIISGQGTASPSMSGAIPETVTWLSQYLGFTYEYKLLDMTVVLQGGKSFLKFNQDEGKAGKYDITWSLIDNSFDYDSTLLRTDSMMGKATLNLKRIFYSNKPRTLRPYNCTC